MIRMPSRRYLFLAGFAIVGLGLVAWAADGSKNDRADVPLEVQPTDSSLAKIVLVAGHPSHGPGEHEFFAGCALLMKLLKENAGVAPVMVGRDWPRDPKTFENARAVVFYMDGGAGHPILRDHHLATLEKLLHSGVGFVNLHYAVEYPNKFEKPILRALGGYYETGVSINPTWNAHIKSLPHHPITRGVHPFTITDEWYYNIHFVPKMQGVTPILKATPPDSTRGTPAARQHPGREEVLAWAYNRADGGRSFGFTGGHYHHNWANKDFRRLVVNAILWSAKVEVPKGGAKVTLTPGDLAKHLDRKGR
jgi:type 1 glutamine amidotransferase